MMEAEPESKNQRIYLVLQLVPKTFSLTCTVLTSFRNKCCHSCLISNATEGGLQRMVSDDLHVNWTYFFPKSLEWNHSIKSRMASPIPDVPVWRSLLQKQFLVFPKKKTHKEHLPHPGTQSRTNQSQKVVFNMSMFKPDSEA